MNHGSVAATFCSQFLTEYLCQFFTVCMFTSYNKLIAVVFTAGKNSTVAGIAFYQFVDSVTDGDGIHRSYKKNGIVALGGGG